MAQGAFTGGCPVGPRGGVKTAFRISGTSGDFTRAYPFSRSLGTIVSGFVCVDAVARRKDFFRRRFG